MKTLPQRWNPQCVRFLAGAFMLAIPFSNTSEPEGPLDAALFEVPEGFRQVENTRMNLAAAQERSGFWDWIMEGLRNLFH
jgi:hypothetical protein